MDQLAVWIEHWTLAEALRRPGALYPLVNAAHVLGIGLLLGAILPLDLRLLLGGSTPLQVLAPFLSRAAGIGLTLALLTGFALFAVKPREYLGNGAFIWKMVLLSLALINVALQHVNPGWARVVRHGTVDAPTRILAALSVLAWLGCLVAGRWIGFL
ncbi:DUF2214 domain-containing protein [Paracoccus sp. CPCC 101403]|uniref:DUF2214 domain-containing protein n=1 Tax=Paracoccus broussonetiae TaxID=3075834 RepID=A0ABU3EDZ3_9RHOB|nr:DUF2214 domain-containing protein [Paracoccus sp. CPCC 101403]MDT1062458.1 DUF2214 domain-containing protein [Paracoccus sp. CPCC 101403]